MDNWTVCARGPSLVQVTPADLLEGPAIAVNGALRHHIIAFTHWIGLDDPDRFIPAEVAKPWGDNPPPIAIAKQSNLHKWTARWPDLVYETYDEGRGRKGMRDLLPWKSNVDWMHWTVLAALHYCVMRQAKHIRLLGADMKGETYAYSDSRIGGKNKTSEMRWERERRDIERAFQEIRDAGIEIERVAK